MASVGRESPDQDVRPERADPRWRSQVVRRSSWSWSSRRPGDWFEDTLASIAAQRYSNSSPLVIDVGRPSRAGSDRGGRAGCPGSGLEGNPGFATACNEALRAVRGAAFFLFCQRQTSASLSALQVMVEEAFGRTPASSGRSSSSGTTPTALLSVGMGAGRTGYPYPTSSGASSTRSSTTACGTRSTCPVPSPWSGPICSRRSAVRLRHRLPR